MSRKRNQRRRNLGTQNTTEAPEVVDNEQPVETVPEMENTADMDAEADTEHVTVEAPDNDHLNEIRQLHNLPDVWVDTQVRQWESWWGRQKPNTRIFYDTDDGRVYNFDPDRVTKPLGDWTNSEIQLWLSGHLTNPGNGEMGAVVNEARRRWAIEPAWTDKQVVQYHRTGATPPQAQNGVWVNDKTRPKRPAKEWTTPELEAWLSKEIQAVGEATEGRLAIEAKKRFHLKGEATSPEQVRKAYRELTEPQPLNAEPQPEETATTPTPATGDGIKDLPPMKASFIQDTLARYAKDVKPGTVVSETQGVSAQRALNSVFDFALKQEGNDFLASMNAIKDFVASERDQTFSPSYIYRFTRSLPLSNKRRLNHINLIELFRLATDPNPAVRKQADYNRLTQGFQPAMASKLLDYFRHYA